MGFTGIIYDIILIAVIALIVVICAKKGFIASSKSIISLILTIVLMISLQGLVLDKLQETAFGKSIKVSVSEKLGTAYEEKELPEDADTSDPEQAVSICKSMPLPSFLSDSIEEKLEDMSQVKRNVMDVIADSVTQMILRVIAFIILFILVHLIVFFGVKFLDKAFDLPVLKTINKYLGGAFGVINALLIIYIACGVIGAIAPTNEFVGQTFLLKFFYDHNILIGLFI